MQFKTHPQQPQAGGPAVDINYSVSITNNSYIAGGGGGGGTPNANAPSGNGGLYGGGAGNGGSTGRTGAPGIIVLTYRT